MRRKFCPICGAAANSNAVECDECGASLAGVTAVEDYASARHSRSETYDFHYGETDLVESSLKWKGGTYLLGGVLVLAALACVGLTAFAVLRLSSMVGGTPVNSPLLTLTVDITTGASDLMTNTPLPTMFLPTVTADAPPTRTATPLPSPTETPGPCMQQVQPGDSLIALVSRCGHRDLDVIDLVLEINSLSSPELIQVGQTIEIPWPTPTPGPVDAQPTATGDGEASANVEAAFVPTGETARTGILPTETLQPGVTWHTVAGGETIIAIAFEYGADIKILSELNPEVTFSQCDFGEFGGGPSCVVTLIEGQRIRVPAPTPTPTLSPTPSGSETPTPTPTPTFNAPAALSPGNRALFRKDELVTLRWVASGTLGEGQIYRVMVDDVTNNRSYSTDTTDLSLIVPESWQGQDSRRHEYSWVVSVIDVDNPDHPYFSTEPRIFVWEGTGGS